MSNEMVYQPVQIPAGLEDLFGVSNSPSLSEGVGPSFAVLSIRGKVFRISYQGDEQPLVTPEGSPLPTLDLVMVGANEQLSRAFYAKRYEPGATESPDCMSANGIKPDPSSPEPQHVQCNGCPQDVFGSRMTDDGRKTKACATFRRTAVVPANDIPNIARGGPMLLRVPYKSLKSLAEMGDKLAQIGEDFRLVVIRIGFDLNSEFPSLTFKPVNKLNSAQVQQVAELIRSGQIEPVLATDVHYNVAAEEEVAGGAPAPTPVQAQPQPQPAAVVPTPTPTPAQPAEAPVEAEPQKKPRGRRKKAAAPAPTPATPATPDLFATPQPAPQPPAATPPTPAAQTPAEPGNGEMDSMSEDMTKAFGMIESLRGASS